MAVYIGYGRNQLPEAELTATVNPAGNVTSNTTRYIAIQGYNLAGYNLLAVKPTNYTVLATEKLDLSLSANLRLAGEFWLGFVISASTSSDPTTFVQLAKIRAVDPSDNETILPFPLTLSLDEDDHFALSAVVADDTFLPTTTILHGMRRGLLSTGLIYEYDAYDQTSIIDNQLVFDGPGGTGRWRVINSFSTYLSSIANDGGCAQDMRNIISGDSVLAFNYDSTGTNSPPVTLMVTNDNSTTVPLGARVSIAIRIGELNKSNIFDQKLELTFLGFSTPTTGALRTDDGVDPLPSVGIPQNYNANVPNLILEDDMAATEAYVFEARLKFADFELGGLIPDGAFIRILPSFILASGVYSEAGALLGDGIFPVENRRRVVPGVGLSLLGLEGEGIVASYVFPLQPEVSIFGLLPNTASQTIAVNQNGSLYHTSVAITADAAQRALVGTVAGETSPATTVIVGVAAATNQIQVDIVHPFNADSTGLIRPDYPDVIAGLDNKALANAPDIKVYVNNLSEVRSFTFTAATITNQQVFINDWTAGVIEAGGMPGAAAADFGLFAPGTITGTAIAGGANFVPGNHVLTYVFLYDGNQVTSIDHSEVNGNIPELELTLAQLLTAYTYWREPVDTYATLTAIPSNTLRRGIQRKVLVDGTTIEDYVYDDLSVVTPSVTVYNPDDITPPAPGRWVRAASLDPEGDLSTGLTEADVRRLILIYSNP